MLLIYCGIFGVDDSYIAVFFGVDDSRKYKKKVYYFVHTNITSSHQIMPSNPSHNFSYELCEVQVKEYCQNRK